MRSPVPAFCRADVRFEACCPGGETEVCRVAISIGAAPVIVKVQTRSFHKVLGKEQGEKKKSMTQVAEPVSYTSEILVPVRSARRAR